MTNSIKRGVDYLKGLIFFIILAVLILTGCANTLLPIQKVDIVDSELVPTGPIESEWKTLPEPEQLKKFMDANCDEINSVSIIKYQDNTKTSTANKNDPQSLAAVCDLLSSLSIVQTGMLSPEKNIVYEITFYLENDKNTFLSFGPAFDDGSFCIGGSFIKFNNFSPHVSIVQTNKTITFKTIESVLESLLANGT